MKPVTTLAISRTPDGEPLLLQEHDGQYFMKVGGVQLMGTNASSSEKEMADLACTNLPRGARVLIGGLGFGYTLRRVLELCPPDASVDVAELLQVVVDWNREFLTGVNGLLVDDPRVHIHIRDVADLISRAGENRYHAILLDVDNSPPSIPAAAWFSGPRIPTNPSPAPWRNISETSRPSARKPTRRRSGSRTRCSWERECDHSSSAPPSVTLMLYSFWRWAWALLACSVFGKRLQVSWKVRMAFSFSFASS